MRTGGSQYEGGVHLLQVVLLGEEPLAMAALLRAQQEGEIRLIRRPLWDPGGVSTPADVVVMASAEGQRGLQTAAKRARQSFPGVPLVTVGRPGETHAAGTADDSEGCYISHDRLADGGLLDEIHRQARASAERAAPSQGNASACSCPPGPVEAGRRVRVMIIDDEEAVRDVVEAALGQQGMETLSCCDGVDGLEQFSREHDRVDLVVLDMIMPRMGGEEAFQRMHEIDPHVPVLLFSGYTVDEAAQRCLAAGACGFIAKPFHVADLVKRATWLVGESRRKRGLTQ